MCECEKVGESVWCVCVRERESVRKWERVCAVCVRESECERESVCVRESLCV